MKKNKLLRAALRAAKRGCPVLPLQNPTDEGCSCGKGECKNVGKHPRTPNGFKDATTDPRQIRKWWKRWPRANIGVRTGKVSGFIALDVDKRNGGFESLRELEKEHGPLPDGPQVKTGGGGLHKLFKCPSKLLKSRTGIMPGMDIKAEGGYIVIPPSLHASGKRYSWVKGKSPRK